MVLNSTPSTTISWAKIQAYVPVTYSSGSIFLDRGLLLPSTRSKRALSIVWLVNTVNDIDI
ncbi:MAG: hypothetical protein Q9204_008993, partial [Flavoplaca sp. TL-2023a]